MWICDDVSEDGATVAKGIDNATAAADEDAPGEKPAGYYVTRATGLFPAPLPQDSDLCNR